MSQPASVALITARTLLNDDAQNVWTDSALMPKLQLAHRELQAKLRANACPVTRNTTSSLVAAYSKALSSSPTDLIEPVTLWEKDPAEPDSAYIRMTEYDPLPMAVLTTRLIYWKWTLETIEFIGSTAQRKVNIYYKRLIPIPGSSSDPLGMIDAEFYIAPRTAALAFGSTGNPQAADWCTNMALQTVSEIIVANRGRSAGVQRP